MDENKVYTKSESFDNQLTTNCQPSDNQTTAQGKLSKGKLSKDDTLSTDVYKKEPFDYQSVVECFNSICKSLPRVHKITDTRKRKIKMVFKQLDGESFETLFTKAEASDFLTGRSGKDWKADFDFIMRPDKAIKIMEGSYDSRYSVDETSQLYQTDDRENELALQRMAFGDILDEGGDAYA